MALNKSSGDMYKFADFTFNIIKGKCSSNCAYCYMKRFPQKEIRFDEKELKTDLGENNTIFIGSSCDMWNEDIPFQWISKVLDYIDKYPKNTYIFQSKNPQMFIKWRDRLKKKNIILGTTIETNIENDFTGGQKIIDRAKSMAMLEGHRTFVTIEPIILFDLDNLVFLIQAIEPEFVNIGADSNHKKDYIFPEPLKEKIELLIKELEKFTIVNKKDNLKRLLT